MIRQQKRHEDCILDRVCIVTFSYSILAKAHLPVEISGRHSALPHFKVNDTDTVFRASRHDFRKKFCAYAGSAIFISHSDIQDI